MGANRFEKLLEPGKIGSLKIKNRMIKSGAAARYWGLGGVEINDTSKHYYEAFARGGIGLLIVEGPHLDPKSMEAAGRMRGNYRLDDDKYIKPVSEVVNLIHKHDCPCFVQFNHTANWQKVMFWAQGSNAHDPPLAPSPVRVISEMDNNNEMPREITIPELQEIVDAFASTAVRCQKAGFDGIEVNAASTHLIHAFLSPFWNKRTDAYGCQSLENRSRFLVEILSEIKKRCGPDYPVEIILNGAEFGNLIGVDNRECLTAEDSRGIAKILEAKGADAIEVRSQFLGRHDASFLTDHFYYPEPPIPFKTIPKELYTGRRGEGANMYLARDMKKALKIPVLTVGRLDPTLGEQMIRDGMTDFVCFTRRLIADPELPNKVAAGRIDDIAPCMSCTCCKTMREHRRCRVNGATGTDRSYVVEPAKKKKKVVVIGGGPAGMEAARVASMRGHSVTLFEKSRKPGGLLPLAAMVKGIEIERLPDLVSYLKRQIVKNGVDIRPGRAADATTIEALKPDAVVVATGGIPAMPEIPGIENRKLVQSAELHKRLKFFLRFLGPVALRRLTRIWMPIGKRVVIMGGDIHGCELAEFLTKRGRKVTIIDTAPVLGTGIVEHLRAQLLWWFKQKGVEMYPGVIRYEGITDKGVRVLTPEGYVRTFEGDTIIPLTPFTPDTALAKALEGIAPEVYFIGDCREPKLIVDAIGDGFRVGREI